MGRKKSFLVPASFGTIRKSDRRGERWVDSRLELLIVENSLGVSLHGDVESGVDESFGGGRGESRTMLVRLGLASEPERLRGHDVGKRWCVKRSRERAG